MSTTPQRSMTKSTSDSQDKLIIRSVHFHCPFQHFPLLKDLMNHDGLFNQALNKLFGTSNLPIKDIQKCNINKMGSIP